MAMTRGIKYIGWPIEPPRRRLLRITEFILLFIITSFLDVDLVLQGMQGHTTIPGLNGGGGLGLVDWW